MFAVYHGTVLGIGNEADGWQIHYCACVHVGV